MDSMIAYDVFIDHGTNIVIPTKHKCIKVFMIFDVKHDGRHKARLVADGHLTDACPILVENLRF